MYMAKKSASKKKPPAGNPWPGRLLELRERWGSAKKLPQADAAERVGVSRRSWIAWEQGKQIPARPVQILIELLLEKARVK